MIRCRLLELHVGFIFLDPLECNVNTGQEFYANKKDRCSFSLCYSEMCRISFHPDSAEPTSREN